MCQNERRGVFIKCNRARTEKIRLTKCVTKTIRLTVIIYTALQAILLNANLKNAILSRSLFDLLHISKCRLIGSCISSSHQMVRKFNCKDIRWEIGVAEGRPVLHSITRLWAQAVTSLPSERILTDKWKILVK